MTIYDLIKQELEHSPSARERRFRAKAMRELVLRKLGLENQMFIPQDRFIEVLDEYGPMFESYMRTWRMVTQDHEELRGHDWEDGRKLADEYEIKVLGREVGFAGDIKKLALIGN